MRGLPEAGAAVRGLDLAGKGKGGVLTGRRNSALRQEARFLLVTADLRAAQLRPWSSQGRRGVQTARARVRDPTIIGSLARRGEGAPAQYRAPRAQARSLDI